MANTLWERFSEAYKDNVSVFNEAVIDLKCQEASDINNAGPVEQWSYLASEGGLDFIEQILEEIEDEKATKGENND